MPKGLELTISKSRILISIPHSVLRHSSQVAFEQADASNLRVSNQGAFAKEVFGQLREEDEDGTTLVHKMLDAAMLGVVEDGGEGLAERRGED